VVDLENITPKLNDLIGSNHREKLDWFTYLHCLHYQGQEKTRQRNEPLVDYSSSLVVTLNQYLTILKQKVMDKEIADKLKEHKVKEREKKKV
jgi:hypothetical protein